MQYFTVRLLVLVTATVILFGHTIVAQAKCQLWKFSLWAIIFVTATAAFGPASANCRLTKIATMSVLVVDNKPLVKAAINGKPAIFLFDTGAGLSLIFRPTAERLDLPRTSLLEGKIGGIGGSARLTSTRASELVLGDWVLKDWDIAVGGGEGLLAKTPLSGVIGWDLFGKLDVEMDFANSVIHFYKPTGCQNAVLAYWEPKNYLLAELDSRVRGASIRTIVEIEGEKVRADLDSGAHFSTLDISVARRLGRDPDKNSDTVQAAGKIIGIGQKTEPIWFSRFKTIHIGDETIHNANLRFGRLVRGLEYAPTGSRVAVQPRESPEMLLGFDFIKAHRIYVANSQGLIYFTHNGGPIFSLEPDLGSADQAESGSAEP